MQRGGALSQATSHSWIPASAGMTKGGEAQRTASMALQRAGLDYGASRGAEPLCVNRSSPKIGGQRGLIHCFGEAGVPEQSIRTPFGTRRPHAAA